MPLPKSAKWVSGRRPTTEQGSNPKDELGVLKVPLELVSVPAQVLQAFCMVDGDEKYGPYNYRVSKVHAYIYLEAALRHVKAIIEGEDYDPLTGKPHIGYALATLGIYADAWINANLIDDRPLPGRGAELITALNRLPGEPERSPQQVREIFEKFLAKGRVSETLITDFMDKLVRGIASVPTSGAYHLETTGAEDASVRTDGDPSSGDRDAPPGPSYAARDSGEHSIPSRRGLRKRAARRNRGKALLSKLGTRAKQKRHKGPRRK